MDTIEIQLLKMRVNHLEEFILFLIERCLLQQPDQEDAEKLRRWMEGAKRIRSNSLGAETNPRPELSSI